MSITLTTNCVHIEQAVPDLVAAVRFMEGVLGADKIEQEIVRFINVPDHRVLELDHLGCGDAVFQFCMPVLGHEYMPAAQYLKAIGPCVTNLNFYVDDDAHTAALLAAEGADTPSKFAMQLMCWDRLLGGMENCKPTEEMGDGYYMGTRRLWGFDFEFAKEPWIDFSKQRIQYPAFVRPRPPSGDRVGRLSRLRVVVDDATRCCDNLTRLISAKSRSQVYDTHEGKQGKVSHIQLRGLELQYCQPLASRGPLRDYLQRYGPGVSAVVFTVNSLDVLLAAADQRELASVEGTYVDWSDEFGELAQSWRLPRTYRLSSRKLLGFDIDLEQV